MSEVHAQARTTPRTRAEIKNSTASLLELAKRYNISVATVRKWKQRDSQEDLSHRPHKLCTTLTPAQEAIVVALRSLTLLALDDLVAVVREFINPDVSRSGLDRCLRRHGVANLRQLQAKALADAGQVQPPVKTFKDYEPGFLHMDIKYLPKMPDEKERRYLFVAIDRATRWVFMHIYANQSERSSVDFLNRLERAAPMKIVKLLTDNGSQFTDRFTSKKREATGQHAFDVRCTELGIEHRLCPPRHPQTNGMVERFNGRISEVVSQTRFASAAELETTLARYVKTYNQQIPQRALNHLSPIQALKEWQKKKPELFKKRIYNQPGLDNYRYGDAEPATGCRAHVIKLHGSIDWHLGEDGKVWRVRDKDLYPDRAGRVLIYPQATKYIATQRDPFAAQFDVFRRTLSNGSDNVLAICGYSFGDDHINQEIEFALSAPTSKTTILAFCEELDDIIPPVLEAWRQSSWGKRVYVMTQRGLYAGPVGPLHGRTDGSSLNWWTFGGVTDVLQNGAEGVV